MSELIPPEVTALIGRSKQFTYQVTARDIRRFAQAIGETNPIHHDEGFARTQPDGVLVAPPLFCQSLAYEDAPLDKLPADGAPIELDLPLPAKRTVGGGSQFTLNRPVLAGDSITVTSTLKNVSTKQGKSGVLYLVEVETTFVNQKHETVATEIATFIKRV